MVAFLGVGLDVVEKFVEEVNADLDESEKIHISLKNSPTNNILSGHRSSLIKFHEKHRNYIVENKKKFIYLRTTCPLHCSMMKDILSRFRPDIERLKLSFPGSLLKFPVHSFYDGRNIQEDKDLAITLCEDIIFHSLTWSHSIKPAADNSAITHVIDFGPGKASQRLTADTFTEWGCDKPVLSTSIARDFKKLLE